MKVIATNIAQRREIQWKGKIEFTGIYKEPVNQPVFLGKQGVEGDTIVYGRAHGGVDKACYLFSADQYPYWKQQYPHLDWGWGMFGENLSISGMDDSQMCIGDVYRIGTALVEVTQPREPCYKLGIKFGDQDIITAFVHHGYPGTYVRILEEGQVNAGDPVVLVDAADHKLSVKDFFHLIYAPVKDPKLVALALKNPALPEKKKEKLRKFA